MIQEIDDKYYELIISFIKEHRKYNDCVDIVDDIAKDVLERSRIVVENINDDSVIEEYLKKAVANSMITVSRKLKIDTRKSNVRTGLDINSNNNLIQDVNNTVDNSEITNEAELPTVTQEYVDKMINSVELINQNVDELQTADEFFQVESIIGSDDSDSETNFETFEIVADESPVDIGNEVAEVSQDDLTDIEALEFNTDENAVLDAENEVAEINQDDMSDIEALEFNTDENALLDAENEVAEINQDDMSDIEALEFSTDENAVLDAENEVAEINQDDMSDIEALEFNTDENAVLDAESEVAEINPDDISDAESLEFNNDDDKSEEISIYTNKQMLSLCRFEASYSNEKLLAQDFIEELLAENAKQPELMLYKIWKLKFRNKLSVLEIANSLNKDKDEILISLNKIIDLAEK